MTPKEFQLDVILKVHVFLKDPMNFEDILDEPSADFDTWMESFLGYLGYSVKDDE